MVAVPIHPFPARMAPEVVGSALDRLDRNATVLDPMCGSGTVIRAAVERGMRAVGSDVDPLAVLMSRVWVTPLDTKDFRRDAHEVVERARALDPSSVRRFLDSESRDFVSFWFAKEQKGPLARLGVVLRECDGPSRDAMALALSRTIVSKKMQASLARDTSHSRPHRVSDANRFDVYRGFEKAVDLMCRRMQTHTIKGTACVRREDARLLVSVEDGSVDAIVTSPPYLNAIDYLRGHRLALVWLGYTVSEIRDIRSGSIGVERVGVRAAPVEVERFISVGDGSRLERRHVGWVHRYVADMVCVIAEMRRVLSRRGVAVLVVGNSVLRGAHVDNAGIVETVAVESGLRCVGREVREIPAHRRYLPPPSSGGGALDSRMREETVLYFER